MIAADLETERRRAVTVNIQPTCHVLCRVPCRESAARTSPISSAPLRGAGRLWALRAALARRPRPAGGLHSRPSRRERFLSIPTAGVPDHLPFRQTRASRATTSEGHRMLRTLVAVAALALGLSACTPVGAQAPRANTLTVIDDGGDVLRFPMELASQPGGTLAPRQPRNDIRQTVISHSADAVTARVKFSELSRKPGFYLLTVRLRTGAGMHRYVSLFVDRESHWRGIADFMRPNGRPVDCDVAHQISYTHSEIRVSVPHSCLNNPQQIQANIFTISDDAPQEPPGLYGDSAHGPQRPAKPTWTRPLNHPQAR